MRRTTRICAAARDSMGDTATERAEADRGQNRWARAGLVRANAGDIPADGTLSSRGIPGEPARRPENR